MNAEYLLPWIISNIVGGLLLLAGLRTPRLARSLFFLLFAAASVVNTLTALHNPELYLDYASTAIGPYRNFIEGWFAEHARSAVTLIAVGQGMIAVGMVLSGWWVRLACIGAIIFLLAIAPLGVGSAFPFSITVSLAAYFILRRRAFDYLWKRGEKISTSERDRDSARISSHNLQNQ